MPIHAEHRIAMWRQRQSLTSLIAMRRQQPTVVPPPEPPRRVKVLDPELRAESLAQLQKRHPFVRLEEDTLSGDALPQHLILGLEELDLLLEVVGGRTSDQKQQRLEEASHSGKNLRLPMENARLATFLYTEGDCSGAETLSFWLSRWSHQVRSGRLGKLRRQRRSRDC